MSVISNGRQERKEVTAQLEKRMKDWEERQNQRQQEGEQKQQELAVAPTSASR